MTDMPHFRDTPTECGNIQRNICGDAIFGPAQIVELPECDQQLTRIAKNCTVCQGRDGFAINNGRRHRSANINDLRYVGLAGSGLQALDWHFCLAELATLPRFTSIEQRNMGGRLLFYRRIATSIAGPGSEVKNLIK